MKVFGEEAGARLGGACPAPTLGVCRGLPGAPRAWLQLWQRVMFMFLKTPHTHFLLRCEPQGRVVVTGLCGVEWEGAWPPPMFPFLSSATFHL